MMNIKVPVLQAANFLGADRQFLQLYDQVSGDEITVEDTVKEYQMDEEPNGKVLFPLVQSGHRVHAFWDSTLAHAFRTRGYEPHVLVCDNQLDLCHAKREMDNEAMCHACEARGQNITNQFGIETTAMSEILPDNYNIPNVNEKNIKERHGVDVSEFAVASARCHLRKYSIDWDDPHERQVYDRFLKSAIICADVGDRLFRQESFDAMLTYHPAYIYGGVLIQLSERRDVPAYGISAGYRKDSLIFGRGNNVSPMPHFSAPELVEDRLNTPLTGEEEARIDEFFEKRTSGEDTRIFHAKFGQQGLEDTKGRLVGVFTNLNWDGTLDSQDVAFDGPFDWLETTIDTFLDRGPDDVRLVVKTHPAESIQGTNESVYGWLTENYEFEDPAMSDVILLEPETEVDPYTLIEQLDAAVVYRSTAGLESAYKGVPVVVGAEAHYRGHGFTFDPSVKSKYRDLIADIDALEMNDEMLARCRRYVHLFFNENHITFNYHTVEDGDRKLKPVTHEAVASDDDLDLIVARAVSGAPISYREVSQEPT